MFNKIKWKDHNFYYTFDINEPVFNYEYFQFYNGNVREEVSGGIYSEPVKLDYKIKMISSNELMVEGPFFNGYYVVINNIPYPYFEEAPEEPKPEKPTEELLKPEGIYQLLETDNAFYFDKLPEEFEEDYLTVKVKIDEYTNEVYPDYPFRNKKYTFRLNKFHKTEIFKKEKNVIYHIFINTEDGKQYFMKYISDILCYFSNVQSLKQFIKNLELNIPIKSDEELKLLIQENSVKLKRRFGLREMYTENPEYLPIFKSFSNGISILRTSSPLKTASFMCASCSRNMAFGSFAARMAAPCSSLQGLSTATGCQTNFTRSRKGLNCSYSQTHQRHCVSNVIITTVSAFSLPTTKPEPFSASSVKNSSALRSVGTDGFFGQRLS